MTTVPGASTVLSPYFCAIDSESFPVGTLIPSPIAKSETASTAEYNLASSPSYLQGHIQLADRDTDFIPLSRGAHMRLVRHSAIAFLEPAAASINPLTGA